MSPSDTVVYIFVLQFGPSIRLIDLYLCLAFSPLPGILMARYFQVLHFLSTHKVSSRLHNALSDENVKWYFRDTSYNGRSALVFRAERRQEQQPIPSENVRRVNALVTTATRLQYDCHATSA